MASTSLVDMSESRDKPLVQDSLASTDAVNEGTCSPSQDLDLDASDATRRRSLMERGLGPLTVNGVRHSILTLCSTALGGGVLSISYVMATAGLALGAFMITLGAFLAFISTVALMRMSAMTEQTSYAGLLAHCAGRFAAPTLDFMLFLYGNGACIGYLKFLGDFVPALMSLGGDAIPGWIAGHEFAVIAGAIIVLAMALGRDPSYLRFVAPFSIMALIYMAGAVAVQAPRLYGMHIGVGEYGPIRWVIPSIHITDAFSICVFAFNCHLNVLPVAGSLVRPTKARIVKVSWRVNIVQMSFYLVIGITGYLSFLAMTPGDIILGYKATNVAVIIGRVMLSGTMIVATVLNLEPTVKSGLQFYSFFRGGEGGSPVASLGDDSNPVVDNSGVGSGSGSTTKLVMTLVCVFLQALVAILVPSITDVIGLLGATVATAMMLAIPAYCMSVVMPMTPKNRAQQLLLYTCSLISLASVPVKVLTWSHVID